MNQGGNDRVVDAVRQFAGPLLEEMAMELVDIEFRREGQGWVLRLYIDREGGTTLDDCTVVSREVSRFLDVEELIEHAYNLEVSSPGLERPLKKDADFLRFAGRRARIRLREPLGDAHVLVGTLKGMHDGLVELEVDGHRHHLARENISRARLVL